MLNIYVIGCGGIGGYLVELMPQALCSISLDVLSEHGTDISVWMNTPGTVRLPCIADRLVFIDADVFDPHNAIRQAGVAGSKLGNALRKIRNHMVVSGMMQGLKVLGWDAYASPKTFAEMIPKIPEPNQDNTGMETLAASHLDGRLWNTTVVFLCVDNAKTRYEVSQYMEDFSDCLVVNGGNSKTVGHVTIYERHRGAALDPVLYEVYPEIAAGKDKRPDEDDCTTIGHNHDQVAIVNSVIADVMMGLFGRWARVGLDYKDSRNNQKRHNEVFIDLDNFHMTSMYHPKGG